MGDETKTAGKMAGMAAVLRELAARVDAGDDIGGVAVVSTTRGGGASITFAGHVTPALVGAADLVRHQMLCLLDAQTEEGA